MTKPRSAKRTVKALETVVVEGVRLPADPWKAFAYLVSRCASGFFGELVERGRTPTEARNTIIGCFLDMAAGEACRIANKEGREPDHALWQAATDGAFARAKKRTADHASLPQAVAEGHHTPKSTAKRRKK